MCQGMWLLDVLGLFSEILGRIFTYICGPGRARGSFEGRGSGCEVIIGFTVYGFQCQAGGGRLSIGSFGVPRRALVVISRSGRAAQA